MTDDEMTKLCAKVMGLEITFADAHGVFVHDAKIPGPRVYSPLHDDAQAMALVKKLRLDINYATDEGVSVSWFSNDSVDADHVQTHSADLNRAIVECVAVAARQKGET